MTQILHLVQMWFSSPLGFYGKSMNLGPSIMMSPFFEIFDTSLPLVTHFSKLTYGVTSPFGRSP